MLGAICTVNDSCRGIVLKFLMNNFAALDGSLEVVPEPIFLASSLLGDYLEVNRQTIVISASSYESRNLFFLKIFFLHFNQLQYWQNDFIMFFYCFSANTICFVRT